MSNSKSFSAFLKKQACINQMPEFSSLGAYIKLARKRRFISAIQLANNAKINRSTLYFIEKGNPGVSVFSYFSVLRELGFFEDILNLIANDVTGKKNYEMKVLVKQSIKEYKI